MQCERKSTDVCGHLQDSAHREILRDAVVDIMDGRLKGRSGTVKHIFRKQLFLHLKCVMALKPCGHVHILQSTGHVTIIIRIMEAIDLHVVFPCLHCAAIEVSRAPLLKRRDQRQLSACVSCVKGFAFPNVARILGASLPLAEVRYDSE